MTDTLRPDTPPPPGAIPVEKLLPGLRGELLRSEHVIWQSRGSGRAFNAFNRGMILRFGLVVVVVILLFVLMLDNRNPTYNGVAWVLAAVLLGRVALFVWQSSNTPSRQVAMLSTERVISVDDLKPDSTWIVAQRGESRAEGQHLPPHPIIVTGTKERGHIRLNRSTRKVRAYPPFILFNVERPLELAQKIKKTLKIDQPIEDRTK